MCEKQDASVENKLRLLMIYAIVSPDKFEGDKATKLIQVINYLILCILLDHIIQLVSFLNQNILKN